MIRRFLAALLLGASLLHPGTGHASASTGREAVPRESSGISHGDRTRFAQTGRITPEKLERWNRMTPKERDKIRERYRRWKRLPPGERERIRKRHDAWRSLPETSRRYLRERRRIYRQAGPEDQQAIRNFVRRMRQLPPGRRQSLRRRIAELRDLPAPDRRERMMDWRIYRKMSPAERRAVDRFLFSEPTGRGPGGSKERPHE